MPRSYHAAPPATLSKTALLLLFAIIMKSASSTLGGGAEEVLEFGELAGGRVGYRPEAEIALVPMPQIIAAAGQDFAMVGRRGRQHEKVDHVFAALVDEGRNRFARD